MRHVLLLVLAAGLVAVGSAGLADDKPDKDKTEPKKGAPVLGELLRLSPDEFIKRFDKNQDGYLTKDELPPRLAENFFDRADTNGDGKLDKQEVEQMLRVLRQRFAAGAGPAANKEAVERRVTQALERLDTNKDGKISKEEAKGPLAENFDRIDTNKDGYLDKEELRRAFSRGAGNAPGGNRPGPEVERLVNRFLEQMDTNKDGKISKDEAKGPLAENFERIDTNGDGFLDKDELRRAAARLVGTGGGRAPERPGAAAANRPDFDALDKDADGRLTREELKGTPWAEKFNEIDTNKDGKIDRKEFEAYLKKREEKK